MRESTPSAFASRRRFLMLCAGAGGLSAFGLGYAVRPFVGAVSGPLDEARLKAGLNLDPALQTFTRTSRALGADVTLKVLHANPDVAAKALTAAFSVLNDVEDVLSIYRPNSELARLNRTGKLDRPHAHFRKVLAASQEMARVSEGKFDASVQPLWELYAKSKERNALPSASEIEAVRAKVDYRKITHTDAAISFAAPGMKLTFNGIAQGYAADCVLTALKAHGIENALVDTGELTSEGHKEDGGPFRCLSIQHPRDPDAFVGVCAMDGRALATSGDYATYFTDDFLYHHIFDPATGVSPRELSPASASCAPTGMMADALTKPVFISLKKKKGWR